MGKFFTITVKPTITAAIQHAGTFADNTILFDWTAFNIPKGANKLLNVTTLCQGTDGAFQDLEVDYLFAKTRDGGATAPGSLGTVRTTLNGTGYQNHLIGTCKMAEDDQVKGMDYHSIGSSYGNTRHDDVSIVLEGEPESGSNTGYDKLYIGGISTDGVTDFSTAIITSQIVDVSGLSAAQLVNADIEGTDPRTVFSPGDIIHAEDGIILGEIESMADANTITFKTDGSKQYHANGEILFTNADGLANWKVQNGTGPAGDLASGDELYNIHPVTVILSFER